MAQILKVKNKYIVKGLNLTAGENEDLSRGLPLNADITVLDGRKISAQQRKFFYAICTDIGNDRGEHKVHVEAEAKAIYKSNTGKDISLTNCSVKEANILIDSLITHALFMGHAVSGDVLMDYKYNFTQQKIYIMCLKRICCVCGKHADLHHINGSTIGMGRNRDKISHIGAKIIPLCREHHSEFHVNGEHNFMEFYHIEPVIVNKELDALIRRGKIK